jgi:hypothetical protein
MDRRIFRASGDALKLVELNTAPREAVPAHHSAGPCPKALDVVLDLSAAGAPPSWLGAARLGVWRLRHGRGDGSCPLLSELAEHQTEAVTELLARTPEHPEGRRLYRSVSSVDLTSLARTRNPILWKGADILLRCLLSQLSRDGAEPECEAPETCREAPTRQVKAGRVALTAAGRALTHAAQRQVTEERWAIAYRRRGTSSGAGGFHVMVRPGGGEYADPFLFTWRGRRFLFLEEVRCRFSPGVISCMEEGPEGTWLPPRVVLETGCHLSYPFVFEWQGEVYLMPETSANRTLELYRAEEFPWRWALDRVLMRGVSVVDATLLRHAGRFWLFANRAVRGARLHDELCVYHSDTPLGPWEPHAANPVISDVRRARPAGRFLWVGDRLLRPSQDCGARYGHAICLNQVEELTTTTYREVPVGRLGPDWMPRGLATHTLNSDDAYEVLDVKLRLPRRFVSGLLPWTLAAVAEVRSHGAQLRIPEGEDPWLSPQRDSLAPETNLVASARRGHAP